MRIYGIGIDVVEVDRIESAIQRHGEPFLARLFTDAERAYCSAQKRPALHYAARFAAKEAVSKALGTGIGSEANWLDLEIVRDSLGAPKLQLHGAAAAFVKEKNISDIQISLSHAKDYAAANGVAVVQEP